jgi:trigger factor
MYRPTEEEINAQLEMLRRNLAKKEVIEEQRPVQEDDFVLVSYEGLKDGQPFAQTPRTENQMYKIGSAHMSRKFDDALIGMNAGEKKEFEVVYEDDYINKALAGNTVVFNVDLKDIRKEILPELNDELAKEMGAFETFEDLKAEIVKNLTQGYEKRKEQEVNEQIFSALIEKVDFETPEVMVNYELEAMINEAERAFQMNGLTFEQLGKSRDDIREEYRDLADKQVRRHIILSAIIDQDNLVLTDEEIAEGYEDTAKAINQSAEMVKSFYDQNPDKLNIFKHTLLEKKIIKLIINDSDVTEVEPELETEES